MTDRKLIDEFLDGKHIAVVGVSRNEKDFSRALYRDLVGFGYDLTPVHPEAGEIEGTSCARKIQDIAPPVDGVLIMTRPEATEEVVKDCAEAGVKRVWMYRGAGQGAVSQKAIDNCEANGIDVVPGHCPYMFIQQAGWVHKFHGFLVKLTGRYPR